ncbi:MAG: DeoR family transcriptional regulator, partial [Novosphingobium sp. 16-62-11]
MHAEERERRIFEALRPTGFVSYRDLEVLLDASPATIRRDLARLEDAGQIVRVHGVAKLPEGEDASAPRLM